MNLILLIILIVLVPFLPFLPLMIASAGKKVFEDEIRKKKIKIALLSLVIVADVVGFLITKSSFGKFYSVLSAVACVSLIWARLVALKELKSERNHEPD